MKTKPAATLIALAFATMIFLATPPLHADTPPMTNDDIIVLMQSGVSEANIIDAINKATPGFDSSPAGLSALSKAKVPQSIIALMQQKNTGLPAAFLTQPTSQAAPNSLPEAIAALKAFENEKLPPEYSNDRQMQQKWDVYKKQEITKKANALYAANPKDPLRWEAALFILKYDSSDTSKLAKKLQSATDLPPDVKMEFEAWQISRSMPSHSNATAARGKVTTSDDNGNVVTTEKITVTTERAGNARAYMEQKRQGNMATIVAIDAFGNVTGASSTNNNPAVDIKKTKKDLLAFLARWPAYDATTLIQNYIATANPKDNDAKKSLLKEFQNTPNASVSSYVAAQLNQMEQLSKPLTVSFTSLDNREINLEKLRGQVVLLYFWRYAAGSTDADYENFGKLYKTYHSKGFEIIGVCLEHNKDKVIEFLRTKSAPWLQNFEDKTRSQNPITKACGIDTIPNISLVLVDKKGAFTPIRSSATLESEIKRLLRQK